MGTSSSAENRVAVLVDCDNTTPEILAHALRIVAQFGRVVIRRGYGNQATLGSRWQQALVTQAFTPHLQYQYASGKNTADIALALDALEVMFDDRADTFCLVTSDSDFSYLCRKLRERGAVVCVVGETKTPDALRNASDHFFEWSAKPKEEPRSAPSTEALAATVMDGAAPETPTRRQSPENAVVQAISLLANAAPEGKVSLGSLGLYLRRTDPAFNPSAYGFTGLLDMLKNYRRVVLTKEPGGHYTARVELVDGGNHASCNGRAKSANRKADATSDSARGARTPA